jgi:hypothetical protein
VVFGNGRAAVIGSATAGIDGIAGIALCTRLAEYASEERTGARPPPRPGDAARLEALSWDIDEHARATLAAAREAAEANVTDVRSWYKYRLDRGVLERIGIGTDAFFHSALQLALLRTFGPDLWIEQREFVALDGFADGTVTTRSVCTPELMKFVAAAAKGRSDRTALRALLREANHSHRARVRDLKEGKLYLQRLAYLAGTHEEIRPAYAEWIEAYGGVDFIDTPGFWSLYGEPSGFRVTMMSSGLKLTPEIVLFGRFGVEWPAPTIVAHYFPGSAELDVLFHAHRSLHPEIPKLAAALATAWRELLGLAPLFSH